MKKIQELIEHLQDEGLSNEEIQDELNNVVDCYE